ncbi:hypothetical protein ACTWP6_04970 [Mycobacterium sp. 4D054]|uniref:hypothetical protein n=1 Tax=Mycobacterium sp. 4D054 TaxID=3457440 RepID=UPI003FD2F701
MVPDRGVGRRQQVITRREGPYSSVEWRRQVLGATGLSADQKNVLIALETYADYRDGTNARPGDDRLAAMCNLKPRAVRNAMALGRELGLIERTSPANPKRGLAAVYRLVTTGTAVPVEPSTTGTAVPVEPCQYRHGGTPIPAPPDRTTGTAVPPTFQYLPSTKGESPKPGTSPAADGPDPDDPFRDSSANSKPATAAATAAPARIPARVAALPLPMNHRPKDFPDPEPAPFCANHPGGTSEPCRDCGDVRKAHDAWEVARKGWRAEHAAANRAWRAACDECDDEDGCVKDPDDELGVAVRCPHATIWWQWWQHHLRRPRCPQHAGRSVAAAVDCADCARAGIVDGRREAS